MDGFETDKISASPSKISFLYKSINTSTSSFVEREQKYFLILKILIDEAVGQVISNFDGKHRFVIKNCKFFYRFIKNSVNG